MRDKRKDWERVFTDGDELPESVQDILSLDDKGRWEASGPQTGAQLADEVLFMIQAGGPWDNLGVVSGAKRWAQRVLREKAVQA